MGKITDRIAKALDSTAARTHEAGTKLGGETGGNVADAVLNATLGPIRGRINCGCTRTDCQHDD